MSRLVRPLALVVALALVACGGPENASPPDQHAFYGSMSEGLTYCPGATTLEGIDVSQYQGTIDWQQVKDSGRTFAIARAAHVPDTGASSTWQPDPTFATNWSEMKRVGLVRGAYQYFVNSQDAAAQARLFLQAVPSLDAGDLPPVLDVEDPNSPTSATAIQTWVDTVRNALGRDPIIYTGAYYWSGWSNLGTSFTTTHDLWLPNYCSHPSDLSTCAASCPPMPAPWTTWVIHQYADNGDVPGISGAVDLDVFDGSFQDLNTLAARTTCAEACDGKLVVHADCTRTDCGADAGHCEVTSGSPRCVADACPATGTKDVCLSASKIGHCNAGVVASQTSCDEGERCAAAGSAASCVSTFCVPNGTSPAAHDACSTDGRSIAHCDASGTLNLESCPASDHCVDDGGVVSCATATCPAGVDGLACADATTFGRCSNGNFTSLTDCAQLGDVCVTIGAAHCASADCVTATDTSTIAHNVCLASGQLGHCDDTGLLVGADACAAGATCSNGICQPGATTPPNSTPPASGCGCDGASTGFAALGLIGFALRRRRRT